MTEKAPADGTALYRIRGEDSLLLYVGISDDFGRRWKQHAKEQPWWAEMRSLSVDCWYESRREAELAEAAAITGERPKHNKAHAATLSTVTPAGPASLAEFQLGDQVEITKPGWKGAPVVTICHRSRTPGGRYEYYTDGCPYAHMWFIFNADEACYLRLLEGGTTPPTLLGSDLAERLGRWDQASIGSSLKEVAAG